MAKIDVPVPALGESITEATVARWLKKAGDAVAVDESLVELETEKVTMEVPSPVAGVLRDVQVADGADVTVGALLCRVEEGAVAVSTPDSPTASPAADSEPVAEAAPSPRAVRMTPAAKRLVVENGLDPATLPATGPKGHVTKGDVLAALAARTDQPPEPQPAAPLGAPPSNAPNTFASSAFAPAGERPVDPRGEERVTLSRLRRAIAARLKDAQNTAAILTTFNEIDMTAVMDLRREHRDRFEKRHGVRLGFMGFFVRAVTAALREFPAVNAEIWGDQVIYKNYYDIGVAVGTPQGLVVPVLRDADRRVLPELEKAIADFGAAARAGKLTLQDMTGGTFTVTNGGVFGSLLSTPILNPPQSAILGMHKIQKRPVYGEDGEIRPGNMMYVALSYDHRIIDGREAVSFLVRVKELVESPARLLLDV